LFYAGYWRTEKKEVTIKNSGNVQLETAEQVLMYYEICKFSRQAYIFAAILIRAQFTGDAFKARTGFYAQRMQLPANQLKDSFTHY
jgi:hypothetical protein